MRSELESGSDTPPPPTGEGGRAADLSFNRRTLLRWMHLGRMVFVTSAFLWILASAAEGPLGEAAIVAGLLVAAAATITGVSLWRTGSGRPEPGDAFVFAQVVFDAVAVAVFDHLMAGLFTPLFILVIAEGALLLPLAGGVAVGVLVALVHAVDVFLTSDPGPSVAWAIGLQGALFILVAVAVGVVGDRLRRAGQVLGEVRSELRQLRHTTSDILGTISAGVITVDATGALIYLNPSGERLLGLSDEEWSGRPVIGAVGVVAPQLGALLERSIERRRAYSRMTAILPRPAGDLTLGVSTAVLGDPGAELQSVTAIFQDITDQERLAELNRRAERLEAVAELSASLAHEIKNPLASIRSAVEQISRPSLTLEDQALLQKLVLRESDRLSRLLSDFLDFSGLRLGEVETVDIRTLVLECLELARQHPAAAEGPHVESRIAEGPVAVEGDSDLIHRALFNLVLNAIQFAGPEGAVELEVTAMPGRRVVRGIQIEDPVRIVVRDTGPGIEPDRLSRIFDPFYTTRRGGTGLGLAVVHRAVEAHEGAVFVDARPGGGTEFTLLLPGAAGGAGGEEGGGEPSAPKSAPTGAIAGEAGEVR